MVINDIDSGKFKIWRNKMGQLHREDGPAVEYDAVGIKAWYLNGRCYSFKDYCDELLKRNLITEHNLLFLRLKYGI